MTKFKDLECMRVITMILVVFAHVTRMYTANAAIPQGLNDTFITALTEWIYTFHMPAFVAISGAVYYFAKRERHAYIGACTFIQNKIKRLLIPYIFFAIVIVIPTLYYCDLIVGNFWKYNFNAFILVRNARHLWYLIMLFNLLIIFNFFEKYIFKFKKVVFLLTLLIHPLAFLLPLDVFQICNIIYYSLYFMIGYYFQYNRRYIMSFLNRINKLFISILLVLLTICVFFMQYVGILKPMLTSLVCSVLGVMFLYIISVVMSQKESIMSVKLFTLLNKNNFSLYLLHPMIIYVIFYNIKDLNIHPWINIPLVFILSSVLSIFIAELIRAMGLKKVIGEK